MESVIALAPNLFYGTTIAVNIFVLSKHKSDTRIQFIDASGLFKKETNNNVLTDEHTDRIVEVFASKQDVPHLARSVDARQIEQNDWNLSVSSYVEPEDTREKIDIAALNDEIQSTVARINELRTSIDAIVAEIEGVEARE